MRKVILITFVLVSAFLVLRPAEQGYSREANTPAVGAVNNAAADPTTTDTDFDGCNDAEEVKFGLDPNNSLDFPDFNSDGNIDVLDTQAVAMRWNSSYGSLLYDVKYDRAGAVGGGPDGKIDIRDLQYVYGRLWIHCQGIPAPTVAEVCTELQGEAQAAGFTDPSEFACSGDPLPQNIELAGNQMKKRQLQVTITADSVFVEGVDLGMVASDVSPGAAGFTQPNPIPTSPPGAAGAGSFPPQICLTEVCHVVLTNSLQRRSFRGHGPNCNWLSYKQEYDAYYPWHVIINVLQPFVQSGSSFPCGAEDTTSGIDRTNQPFSAESWATEKWVVGIPTPWGLVSLSTSYHEIRAWFDGWYNVRWD